MSAMTILESFDSQMLEDMPSGDYDVAMHTAGSSSDAWYQGESIMDQDIHNDSEALAAADRGSVEVEMETYADADNESVEYEMADEEPYQGAGGEVLDVEVYDASTAHSPAPIPAIEIHPTTTTDHIFTDHSAPVFDERRTPDPHPVLHEEAEEAIHVSSDFNISVVDTTENTPQFVEGHGEVSNSEATWTDGHIETSATEVPVEPVETAGDNVANVVAPAEPLPTPHEETSPAHSLPNYGENEITTQSEQPAAPSDEADHSTEQAPAEEYHHHEEEQQYEQQDEEAGDTTDPHEISDGIYIDPPPAVLLTLSLSDSENTDVVLFNHPSIRSGSQTPVEETHPAGEQPSALLLHHLPTLYYEPLTHVFEALRQEESISQIPAFAEGELTLDAYDLQLVITEVSFRPHVGYLVAHSVFTG